MEMHDQTGGAALHSGTAAVSLSGVSKIYGSFAAIRNLSLTLRPATVVLGENGAGKSTLLRLLAGLTAPTQGAIAVLGGNPSEQHGRVSYMSHASMLYDELSAIENLEYFSALHRGGGCNCVGSPEMALRAVGLDPGLKRPVGQYSQGMRQRTSLANALQTDPDLMLLDEPFSNLDAAGAKQMVDLLADFRTWPSYRPVGDGPNGRTIVLTTHQAHLAESLADVTLTLERGSLASWVSKAEAA
jgi:ABC-type multidrug transport system ATPase subunit